MVFNRGKLYKIMNPEITNELEKKAKTGRSSNKKSSRKSKTRPNDVAPYRLTTEIPRKSGIPFRTSMLQ